MKSYIKTLLLTIHDNFVYRINFVISILTGFIYSYAQVAIWHAITHANKNILSPETINNTIKYILLSSLIWRILFSVNTSEIERRIRLGDIGRDLLYPISFPLFLFFKMMGNIVAQLITTATPTIIILSLIYKIDWNFKLANLLILLIGFTFGFCINFLVNFLVDVLSFWWFETFGFQCIKQGLLIFLGGGIVPLWFYPQWLLKIIDLLPFKNIIYVPIAFYLGNKSLEQIILQLVVYIGWFITLTILCGSIWKAGIKKLVIQGG